VSDDLAAFLLACLYEAQGRAEAQLGIDNERAEFELADIDAKRAILALHSDQHDCTGNGPNAYEYPYRGCDTLRLLALPYVGRDGWREEWRPQ
jgi:hypothetical protein